MVAQLQASDGIATESLLAWQRRTKASDRRVASRLRALAGLRRGTLLVHEIFASIQGESTYAGRPCLFVRTTGCHLRCRYCDTKHAFAGGEVMDIDAVLAEVASHGLELVEITGGEPLLQRGVQELMTRLCDAGHEVLLETSGSLAVDHVDPRVVRIMDIKAPRSGEAHSDLASNRKTLRDRDEVKLVLADREDYVWARDLVRRHRLPERCTVLMGPAHGRLAPKRLAAWILEDRLPVRLHLQLHKTVWGADARGV